MLLGSVTFFIGKQSVSSFSLQSSKCAHKALCPSHPHPAPTRIATWPDFVLAPGVQLQPKQGLVGSQRREAGPSGEPPDTPYRMCLCLIPAGGVGSALGGAEAAWPDVLGETLGGADKIPLMNSLSHMISCVLFINSPHN